jgi:hypothetical protein
MTDLNVVFDCADPDRLARFWMVALPGYAYPGNTAERPDAPPPGYPTWPAWADAQGIPEEQRNLGRTLVDSGGTRPVLFFLRVPEAKTVKNRLHLDLKVGAGLSGEQRQQHQDAEADRLVAAGAGVARRVTEPDGSSWLVMHDPEGNEFCLT